MTTDLILLNTVDYIKKKRYIIENTIGRISIINIFKDEIYHEFISNNKYDHNHGLFFSTNFYMYNG